MIFHKRMTLKLQTRKQAWDSSSVVVDQSETCRHNLMSYLWISLTFISVYIMSMI